MVGKYSACIMNHAILLASFCITVIVSVNKQIKCYFTIMLGNGRLIMLVELVAHSHCWTCILLVFNLYCVNIFTCNKIMMFKLNKCYLWNLKYWYYNLQLKLLLCVEFLLVCVGSFFQQHICRMGTLTFTVHEILT